LTPPAKNALLKKPACCSKAFTVWAAPLSPTACLRAERLGSTGLGHGVAIPHGRIKGLKAPMAAVFQLANPIGFDAPDEQPVGLLIFLLVPEAATQKHLEILSEIAELLSDASLREQIKSSTRRRRAPRPHRRLAIYPSRLSACVGTRGC
jgi:hypothetical protein